MHLEIPPCTNPGEEKAVWAVIDYGEEIGQVLSVRLVVGWAAAVRLAMTDYRESAEDEGHEYDEAHGLAQLAGGELRYNEFRTILEFVRAYDEHFNELDIAIGKRRRKRKAKPAARLMPPPPSTN